MKAWIVFLLLLVGTIFLGVATYLTHAGGGRALPLGLTFIGAGLTVGSFPGN